MVNFLQYTVKEKKINYQNRQRIGGCGGAEGITAEVLGRDAARTGTDERLHQALQWQRVSNSEDTALRAKQRL